MRTHTNHNCTDQKNSISFCNTNTTHIFIYIYMYTSLYIYIYMSIAWFVGYGTAGAAFSFIITQGCDPRCRWVMSRASYRIGRERLQIKEGRNSEHTVKPYRTKTNQ